jgi:hypothetical protein
MTKKYKVKVSFIGHKYYDIEADTIKEACERAERFGNAADLQESDISIIQAVDVQEVTK